MLYKDAKAARRLVADKLEEDYMEVGWDWDQSWVICAHGLKITAEFAEDVSAEQLRAAHDQQLAINEELR